MLKQYTSIKRKHFFRIFFFAGLFLFLLSGHCGDGLGTVNGSVVYVGSGVSGSGIYYNLHLITSTLYGTSALPSPYKVTESGFGATYPIYLTFVTEKQYKDSEGNRYIIPLPECDAITHQMTSVNSIARDLTTKSGFADFSITLTADTYYAYAVYDADADGHFSEGDQISVYNNKPYDTTDPDPIVVKKDGYVKNLYFEVGQKQLKTYSCEQ